MKTALFFISLVLIASCSHRPAVIEGSENNDDFTHARTSGNFSDRGAISLRNDEYRFTVILVKDLEWALRSLKIADYGLPHISQFKRSEKVSPFLTFGTFGKEDVDLTYSVKLQKPDGTFTPAQYNDLIIARSKVSESMNYPAEEFATIDFSETDALGIYQFFIIIKDSGNIINSCIMQFELVE